MKEQTTECSSTIPQEQTNNTFRLFRTHSFSLQQLALPLSLLAGFLLLFALYLLASQLHNNTSDNASIILEGQAMLHGNLIMHGWYLPPDSFITTEMPLDALGSLFFTGEQLLKITPAVLYAATVLGAVWLALRIAPDQTTRTRSLAAGACLAVIAFPVGLLFYMLMQAPMHIGTIVASLIAWLAYDYFVKHPTTYAPLLILLLVTAFAIIGDPLAELIIVAPVGIVSVIALWRSRTHDQTARLLLGSMVVALPLGIGLRQLLIISGTHINSVTPTPVPLDQLLPHLWWLVVSIAMLFHINLTDGVGSVQWWLFLVLNGGFLCLAVLGFARLVRQTLLPTDLRDSLAHVLSWSIILNVAAFLLTNFATNVLGIRYLLPACVYAGILCYRALARVVSPRYIQQTVLAFLVVSCLTFGVMLAQAPRIVVAEQPLIGFLQSHHLSVGFGSYWAANIVTLKSNGQIHVMPVYEQYGQIHAYRWHASADWFQPTQLNAVRFVVIDSRTSTAEFQAAINASFGAPDHIYSLNAVSNTYVIFTWDHPISSLSAWTATQETVATDPIGRVSNHTVKHQT